MSLSKEEYLKRYLSNTDVKKKKTKQKHTKASGKQAGLKILDDDVDFKSLLPSNLKNSIDDDLYEDKPVVVDLGLDDRPQKMRELERMRDSKRWKTIVQEDGDKEIMRDTENTRKTLEHPKMDRSSFERSGRRRYDSESDTSPPRTDRKGEDRHDSPQRRKARVDSDSDNSPVGRITDRGDSKDSHLQKKHLASADSSFRDRNSKLTESDNSPPRAKKTRHDDSDNSPPRARKAARQDDSDNSPPRARKVARHDDFDNSPPRARKAARHDDSDNSPPRARKVARHDDSDNSPPRARKAARLDDSDNSPPRTRKAVRQDGSDNSPPRTRKVARHDDSGNSPPRARKTARLDDSDNSPPRARKVVRQNDSDNSPPRAKIVSRQDGSHGRKHQTIEQKKDVAKPEVTYRKDGKVRDLKAEQREKANEDAKKAVMEDKYKEWNRGLKQREIAAERLADTCHEAAKPLARYKDDEDLDSRLRDQDREGDPMLAFIKKKKSSSGAAEKPRYRGPQPPPNRFNLEPGYRWDGVDRSNGFEKKFFSKLSDDKAKKDIAHKWSVEDM